MNYTAYEVPMYHSGVCVRENGSLVAFISEQTGVRYPIIMLEPESLEFIADLYANDSDFRDHLYLEDITIVHEVSGDIDVDNLGETFEIDNQKLDGLPLSRYPALTDDFHIAIDDTIAQEYMNDGF